MITPKILSDKKQLSNIFFGIVMCYKILSGKMIISLKKRKFFKTSLHSLSDDV